MVLIFPFYHLHVKNSLVFLNVIQPHHNSMFQIVSAVQLLLFTFYFLLYHTVDQLAVIVAVGLRNLERRFKKATSNTVVEYMQRVKIEAAKMSLETGRENVNEVMYNVGYNDPKAFRSTFKRITGLSPVEYRHKYNKAAVL